MGGEFSGLHATVYDYRTYMVDVAVNMLCSHDRAFATPMPWGPRQLGELRASVRSLLASTRASYSVILTAMLYLHRYHTAVLRRYGQPLHRTLAGLYALWSGVLLLANKFLDDQPVMNGLWAQFAHLPTATINHTEMTVLGVLNYELFVDRTVFEGFVAHVFDPRRLQAYRQSPPAMPLTPVSLMEESVEEEDDEDIVCCKRHRPA